MLPSLPFRTGLSFWLTLLATLGAGWGVSYADGVLAVRVEPLAISMIAAFGAVGGAVMHLLELTGKGQSLS